jgi:hypothetical protein
MALAASQSAASAGAAAGAAGAVGASVSLAAGLAGVMASAGIAGQAGAAVGLAAAMAVAAAAVSSGVIISTNNINTVDMPLPQGSFVPPTCSDDSVLKEGYIELHIQGLAPSVLPGQKQVLEMLFR